MEKHCALKSCTPEHTTLCPCNEAKWRRFQGQGLPAMAPHFISSLHSVQCFCCRKVWKIQRRFTTTYRMSYTIPSRQSPQRREPSQNYCCCGWNSFGNSGGLKSPAALHGLHLSLVHRRSLSGCLNALRPEKTKCPSPKANPRGSRTQLRMFHQKPWKQEF